MPPSFLFSDPIVLFWWKIPISFKSNTYRKHWINTCNKKKIVSCLIMTPRYDYTPLLIYYLITRFSLAIWLSLSKNDQYSLLDWTCWIFFQCFLYFSVYLRAPSCYYTWMKKNKVVSTCCLFSTRKKRDGVKLTVTKVDPVHYSENNK